MLTTDEILIEDWQGLESELERLLMIYGYPVDDLRDTGEQDETVIQEVVDTNVPG